MRALVTHWSRLQTDPCGVEVKYTATIPSVASIALQTDPCGVEVDPRSTTPSSTTPVTDGPLWGRSPLLIVDTDGEY